MYGTESKTVPLESALVLSHAEHEEALEVRRHTFLLLAVLHLIMSNFCKMSVFFIYFPPKTEQITNDPIHEAINKESVMQKLFSL